MNTEVETKEFETSVRKWAWEQAIIIKERELNLSPTFCEILSVANELANFVLGNSPKSNYL